MDRDNSAISEKMLIQLSVQSGSHQAQPLPATLQIPQKA